MSNVISKEVNCPKCGHTGSAHLYISINATNEPRFRDDLLSGKLLDYTCPSCGYQGRYTYPLLYNDMKRRFMVYLIPEIDRFQLEDRSLEEDYRNLKGIRKRITANFNALKEKIFIFESGLDDMAVELTKLAVSEVVAKDTGYNVYSGYFTEIDEEKNTISFQFFVGGDKRSYIQSTRLDIYRRSAGIVKKHLAGSELQAGFLNIGREWARESLDAYKNSRR